MFTLHTLTGSTDRFLATAAPPCTDPVDVVQPHASADSGHDHTVHNTYSRSTRKKTACNDFVLPCCVVLLVHMTLHRLISTLCATRATHTDITDKSSPLFDGSALHCHWYLM